MGFYENPVVINALNIKTSTFGQSSFVECQSHCNYFCEQNITRKFCSQAYVCQIWQPMLVYHRSMPYTSQQSRIRDIWFLDMQISSSCYFYVFSPIHLKNSWSDEEYVIVTVCHVIWSLCKQSYNYGPAKVVPFFLVHPILSAACIHLMRR